VKFYFKFLDILSNFDGSITRLIVSISVDMDEEWVTTRKYLNMDVEENEEDEDNEIVLEKKVFLSLKGYRNNFTANT